MKNNKKRFIADMCLLITAIFWGGGFIGVKDAIATIEPFTLLSIRFIFSGGILSVIFFKRFKTVTKGNVIASMKVGVLLFGGFACQTIGIMYTTVGKNAFLTGLNVVFVPFIYWAIKKKFPGVQALLAAILSFIGIGLLTLNDGAISINYGDMLTIGCAIFFAFHIVAIDYFSDGIDSAIFAIMQLLFAGVLSLVVALITEPRITISTINSENIYSIIYIVLFSTMIAFIIQITAQKYTTATHAAIILCMESVFGSIFSVIFLKEVFTPTMILGCIVIFIAIILSEYEFKLMKYIKRLSN